MNPGKGIIATILPQRRSWTLRWNDSEATVTLFLLGYDAKLINFHLKLSKPVETQYDSKTIHTATKPRENIIKLF